MSFSSDQALLVNQLPISVEFSKEQEKFLEQLSILYKRIAQSVNNKEGGLFSLQEQYNSQLYFTLNNPQSFRNVYRKTFDLISLYGGNITNGTTVTLAHNISGISTPTHIYGTATTNDAPVHYIPLPYASHTASANDVELYLTPTSIVLINGQSTLTQCYVVAEYTKN